MGVRADVFFGRQRVDRVHCRGRVDNRRLDAGIIMSENHQLVRGHALASFTAYGTPKGQPRARAFARNGKVRMYDPATAEGWKGSIALAVQDHLPPQPYEGPLLLTLVFLFPRPKAHFRANGLMREDAPLWHDKKPDIDNAAKAVMDALTTIGLWKDDKQVASVSMLKRYNMGAERAGCAITVASLEPLEGFNGAGSGGEQKGKLK